MSNRKNIFYNAIFTSLLSIFLLFITDTELRSETKTFFNVILPDGADPWVIHHSDNFYYMTVSTGNNITIWKSKTLSGLGGGQKKIIWKPPISGPHSKNIWAPEIHYINKKWYVYYAADNGRWENHRMYVLENDSADPFDGSFIFKGKIFDSKFDTWAIDGTMLNLNGKLFFIWSGLEGTENTRANLYIAPMNDPISLSGSRVEISRPRFSWEKIGSNRAQQLPEVNEGPEVIVRGDTIYLIYSASGSWTDDYCLGLLTAKTNKDLLNPLSWKKHDQPIFHRGNGVRAPGHCSFTKSPNGKEDWIIYHSARYEKSGWDRLVRAQSFSWGINGLPKFGLPIPPNEPVSLPGGDPTHFRYEAENASFGGTTKIIPHSKSSGKAKIGFINTPTSFVEFNINANADGNYLISVRFGNGTEGKLPASHFVSINKIENRKIQYPYSGWDHWSNAFINANLKKGKNTIRFSKDTNYAEIDCIDLVPNDNR